MVDLFTSVLQGLGRFPLKGDLLSGITTQPGRNFEGVSIAEYMAYIPELRDVLVGVVNKAFFKAGADVASDHRGIKGPGTPGGGVKLAVCSAGSEGIRGI
jgi:hypothetical protein